MALNVLSITSRAENLGLKATVSGEPPTILRVHAPAASFRMASPPWNLVARYHLDSLNPAEILHYEYTAGLAGAKMPLQVSGTVGAINLLELIRVAREAALVEYRPVGGAVLGTSIPLSLREWVQTTRRQAPGWWGRLFRRKARTPRQVIDRYIATGRLERVQ